MILTIKGTKSRPENYYKKRRKFYNKYPRNRFGLEARLADCVVSIPLRLTRKNSSKKDRDEMYVAAIREMANGMNFEEFTKTFEVGFRRRSLAKTLNANYYRSRNRVGATSHTKIRAD